MIKTFEIEISERDYKKLAKYGFCFEKNINEYLKDRAQEIRAAERENRESWKKNPQIETTAATYTGGGIWIFYGKCKNDNEWFMIDNDGEFIEIFNENPSNFDESLYAEWMDAHRVRTITEEKELKRFEREFLAKCNFGENESYKGWWEL